MYSVETNQKLGDVSSWEHISDRLDSEGIYLKVSGLKYEWKKAHASKNELQRVHFVKGAHCQGE